MRERRDMTYGRDLTPAQIWAAWRRETHAILVKVLTAARVRVDAAPEEEAAPTQ